MSLLIDTSVWSLAMRRDSPPEVPEVARLRQALEQGEEICCTGLILQELLQGLRGPKAKAAIVARFDAIPMIIPARQEYIDAAGLQITCRKRGIQVGTIDALIAQLCIGHELTLLSTDQDFDHMASIVGLSVWKST